MRFVKSLLRGLSDHFLGTNIHRKYKALRANHEEYFLEKDREYYKLRRQSYIDEATDILLWRVLPAATDAVFTYLFFRYPASGWSTYASALAVDQLWRVGGNRQTKNTITPMARELERKKYRLREQMIDEEIHRRQQEEFDDKEYFDDY